MEPTHLKNKCYIVTLMLWLATVGQHPVGVLTGHVERFLGPPLFPWHIYIYTIIVIGTMVNFCNGWMATLTCSTIQTWRLVPLVVWIIKYPVRWQWSGRRLLNVFSHVHSYIVAQDPQRTIDVESLIAWRGLDIGDVSLPFCINCILQRHHVSAGLQFK